MTTYNINTAHCELKRFAANNRKLHKNQVKHIIKNYNKRLAKHIFVLAPFCGAFMYTDMCVCMCVRAFIIEPHIYTLISACLYSPHTYLRQLHDNATHNISANCQIFMCLNDAICVVIARLTNK